MKNKTLIVTIKSESLNKAALAALETGLRESLPTHNVALICVGAEDSVDVAEFTNSENYREES